jgi:hypothetical protein
VASPITHIVLAEQVFDKLFADKDKVLFFVGTSFPDIRRLGKIEREKVHFDNYSLAEIKSLDSFWSGLKFHSAVDLVGTEYAQETGLYKLFPESDIVKEGVEIFQDRLLFNKINRWQEIAGYFDHIYPEELTFGVREEDVRTWHKNLTRYFMDDINSEQGLTDLILGNGNSMDTVEKMLKISKQVRDKAKAEDLILNFYNSGFLQKLCPT